MSTETKTEKVVKIGTLFIAIGGILTGIWQFNQGQKTIAISKFKEFQLQKYQEASTTVASIITTEDFKSEAFQKDLQRFKQLYWVELSAVEDDTVESAMKQFWDFLEPLELRHFNEVGRSEKQALKDRGLDLARAIKWSSRNWVLPNR